MPRKAPSKSEVKISTSDEAEQAVRTYLDGLGQPKKRGRRSRPKPDFEAATKGITDPIAKLAAIKAERERIANIVVGDVAEEQFVKYAKTWARIHGYDREDFAALGVAKRILDTVFGSGPTPAAPAKRTATRAPRANTQDIADLIRAKPAGTWLTVAGVMTEAGGSPATVRKVLDDLAAAGTVTDPIDDPKHSGRGRAPKVWERN